MTPSGCNAITDIQHIFGRERFEEQDVTGVVIGTDRFGIGIDHDRLDAEFAKRETGMAAAVIKLDSLSDTIGTAAQNDDPPLVILARRRLVLLLVGRIKVGRIGFEFGGTGINGLKNGSRYRVADGPGGLPVPLRPSNVAS